MLLNCKLYILCRTESANVLAFEPVMISENETPVVEDAEAAVVNNP